MQKKRQPELKQKERKHTAIIAAAKEVFLAQGYKIASMDEIASVANVSKRTIYDHFGDKRNLFATIIKNHWLQIVKLDAPLFDNKKSLTQNLKIFAEVFLTFLYKPDTINIFRVLISESNQFPDLLDELLVNGQAPFTKALAEYLQQEKQKGKLGAKNTNIAAAYFIGLLKEPHFWPMMLGFIKEKNLANSEKTINDAVAFFLKAST